MKNMKNKRDIIIEYTKETNIKLSELAKESGVSVGMIYKFLKGLDIRLSTWDKLEPIIYRQKNKNSGIYQ